MSGQRLETLTLSQTERCDFPYPFSVRANIALKRRMIQKVPNS